jgi:hypothetical protein
VSPCRHPNVNAYGDAGIVCDSCGARFASWNDLAKAWGIAPVARFELTDKGRAALGGAE